MPDEPVKLNEPAGAKPRGEDRTLGAKPYEPSKRRRRLLRWILILAVPAVVGIVAIAGRGSWRSYWAERYMRKIRVAQGAGDWRTLVSMCREARSSEPFYALGYMRSKEAVPELIAMLADERIKTEAAIALTLIRDDRAIGPLIAMLSDPNGTVRYHVVTGLGSFPTWEVVRALAGRLRDTAGMGGHCLPQWPLWHDVDGTLRAMFVLGPREPRGRGAPEDGMEENAAFWEKFIAENAGRPIIEMVLARSHDEAAAVRARAADVLDCHKRLEAVDRLVEMLGDRDQKVARAATAGLRRAGQAYFRQFPADFQKVYSSEDQEVWRRWWEANRAVFRFD